MKGYIAGWGGKATASLSWGKHGTLRFPLTGDVQYPVTLELAQPTIITPALFSNTASFSSPTVTQTGAVYPRADIEVTFSTEPTLGTTSDINIGSFAAGDRLIVIVASKDGSLPLTPPAGWTLVADGTGASATTSIIYRDMDGSEGSSITVTTSGNSQSTGSTFRIYAGTFDPAEAPEATISTAVGTTTPDPPSVTASWGAANNMWVAGFGLSESSLPTVSVYPYVDFNYFNDVLADNDAGQIATSVKWSTNATENPGTFTMSLSRSAQAFTIVVKGYTPASGTTLTPSLYTNTQSYFGPTIRRTMKPSAHTNNQTFNTQTLRRTLFPAAYTDPDTFYGPVIRRTLRPAAHVNNPAFFTHTLRLTLKPSLHSDGDTFFAHVVSLAGSGSTVSPSLHVNANTFQAHAIRSVIKPGAHANAQAFQTQTLRTIIKPASWANGSALFSPALRRTLLPGTHANAQVFQSPRLITRLSPGTYANSSVIHGHALAFAPALKSPALFVNAQAHYRPTVISVVSGVAPTPLPGGGAPGSAGKALLRYRTPPPLLKYRVPSEGYVLEPVRVERVRHVRIVKGPSKGKTVRVHKVEDDDDEAFIELLKVILAQPD